MPLYVASYDLNKKKDYPKLWAEMARLGGHKALESFYLLNVTNTDAEVLRDHLRTFMDADDSIIVVPFTKRPSTFRTKTGTKEWLDRNCPG